MFDGIFTFVKNAWNVVIDIASSVFTIIQKLVDKIVNRILSWLDSILDRIILILKDIKKSIYLVTNGKKSAFLTAEAFSHAKNIAQNKKAENAIQDKLKGKVNVTPATTDEILEEAQKLALASQNIDFTASEKTNSKTIEAELKAYRIDEIDPAW